VAGNPTAPIQRIPFSMPFHCRLFP
jgi:hypothetical protein